MDSVASVQHILGFHKVEVRVQHILGFDNVRLVCKRGHYPLSALSFALSLIGTVVFDTCIFLRWSLISTGVRSCLKCS